MKMETIVSIGAGLATILGLALTIGKKIWKKIKKELKKKNNVNRYYKNVKNNSALVRVKFILMHTLLNLQKQKF